MVSRRDFLKTSVRIAPVLGGAGYLLSRWGLPLVGSGGRIAHAGDSLQELIKSAPKARYWTTPLLAGGDCSTCHASTDNVQGRKHSHAPSLVKCLLCAQGCALTDGERGKCRARINVGGEMRTLVYGRPITVHVDPIEKKPFYHFLPGSAAFSLATSGCPLRCKFCQNWEISQSMPEDYETPYIAPAQVVSAASSSKAPVIAFTYNEPTVFTEYLTDIAREATKQRFRSVLISCGFMTEAPLAEMCSVLDGIKIDLKGFSESFYRDVSGAELKPVLRSIKQVHASGVHLEIVNLVVPTLNDSDNSLRDLAQWVVGELGPDVPVHFTRFHPDYQLLNLPPTPVATLERARSIALEKGMHYPYVGNVPGHPGNHTYCPGCKKVVIERDGFFISQMNMKDGTCAFCHHKIAGVWL